MPRFRQPQPAPLLPTDLAATIARVGIDPNLPERQLEDAIRDAIGERGGYLDWHYDITGWCVLLMVPDREAFRGITLATALGWCLVWMMGTSGELGLAGFARYGVVTTG